MNALFRFFGFLGCHQRPDRSFFIRGRQLPLCARCTGIFVGYLVAGALSLLRILPPLWVCAIALLFPLADWSAQTWFGRESTNVRRFATGTIGGWGLMTLAIAGIRWCLTLMM
ncbi:MAG: DUF2085 domain-containing protein [Christensenellales bacterium]|jgi:uncharacterized membrane protein